MECKWERAEGGREMTNFRSNAINPIKYCFDLKLFDVKVVAE